MRKLVVSLIVFLTISSAYAQNADIRVSELINSSDWFTLEKEYPLLKDSIQYDYVRLMAEAMLAQNFNREAEAVDLFRTLINSYQQQIGGSNVALSLTEIILGNYERLGMYSTAADKAANLIEQIKASNAPIDYSRLADIHKRNLSLKKYDAPSVVFNNSKDISIPFTMECTDTLLFDNQNPASNRYYIPVTVHGKEYQFMFDTGATTTYFSKRFADLIGVEFVGYSSKYGDYFYLDSLQLGNIICKNIIGPAHNGTPIDSVATVDAVIGMDILQRLGEIQIDNKKRCLVIPSRYTPTPKYGKNLRNTGFSYYVKATDSTGLLNVFLDSGAETGFTYNYFVKHKEEFSQLRGTKELTIGRVDGFYSTMAIKVPSVKFEVCGIDVNMQDVYVPYMNQHHEINDVVLGVDFFQQYDKVILNFKNMFMMTK